MTVALSLRALNRAVLSRQLLLDRVDRTPLDVMELLVGLQAQDPEPPYIGLWNRITGFRQDDLTTLLRNRRVVRSTLYRGTQHLVTAEDYLWLRPALQPMLDRWQRGAWGKVTAGLDLTELAGTVAKLLGTGQLSRPELAAELRERWPDRDPVGLARSAQALLAIVHPPPDGTWGRRGTTPFMLAEEWLGRPLDAAPAPERLVLRYLAAFGPATVRDVQAWSGMTRLREVMDRLRPELLVLRGESGQELFDLPDAPRPEPDRPAPVRFLALLDNVVLAWADRSRMLSDERRVPVSVEPALTVDGFVHALWRIRHERDERAVLVIKPFEPLPRTALGDVGEEGMALLRFAAPKAGSYDIEFQTTGQ
ncbi:winged helix DNA-binding domain-containing protein [Streptomyces sp. NPDC046862]|uniref:winged helix DNA-binding domain-containing protein n=1 Tax=Streptomyces sp. NPDC046862 TaxID=3154603 RepID=UPI0034552041